ncbi:hypothetical protein JYQ62_29720 [Nostoc sp. UHCC 0702]|nr:hypothetical protein JYQ62_29720 [Nostoc sp. UHCC 0702]
MAKIIIAELNLFDSESYLTEMNDMDSMFVYGGDDYALSQVINFALKLLDFVLAVYAIYNITSLAKSFNSNQPNADAFISNN